MKKEIKIFCKILSVFLSVLLIIQMAPMQTFANEYNEMAIDDATAVSTDDAIAESPEATVIAEETSKREENVKHFRMSDGSYRAAQYDIPVHFMLDGEWVDYDNTLTEVDADTEDGESASNKDLRNTFADYSVRLSKKTNGKKFVRIEKDGYKLSWYYADADKVTAKITEIIDDGDKTTLEKLASNVVYNNVYDDVDFEYVINPEGVKENIILNSSDTQNTFVAEYKANGLTPVQLDAQTIQLQSADGAVIYTISAPYMMAANGDSSTNVAITLSDVKNNKFTVTTTLDEEWLGDENRVYPVTVDPVIKTKQDYTEMDSTFVGTQYKDRCYYTYANSHGGVDSGSLYVGNISGYGQTESYLKLNSLPTLSVADKVIGAQLSIFLYDCDDGLQLDVKRITSDWAMNSVTWNTKPTVDSRVVDYAILTDGQMDWLNFDITDLVRGWYSGDYANYGVSFSTTKTSAAKAWLFASDFSEGGLTEYRPIFFISYINMSGLEDYWSYTQQNLGSGVGYVNNATGNLVVNIPICETGSASLPASISYYYNGYQAGYHFYVTQGGNNISSKSICGAGWKLNVDEQLAYLTPGLDNNDDLHEQGIKYTYTDSDGTVLYMKETESGSWVFEDELGKGYTLTLMDDDTWELTDKQKNKKTFTSGGRLLSVQSNQSNDKITYTYAGDMYLSKITDGSGHTISITRNENNAITAITGSLGTTNFYYSGSKLVQIKYPDSKSIYFTYDSAYRLISVTSRDGSKIEYSYSTVGDTANQHRVAGVVEKSSSNVSGNYINFEYNPGNFTKVTDNDGRSVVYNFDNVGRTTSVVDDYGASSTNYTTNVAADSSSTGQYTEQNNKITGVSSTILPVDNLLKNHSFESGKTSWYSQTSCSSVDSTTAFIGSKSIKFASSETTNNAIIYQYYEVPKTGDYTFSFYYKIDDDLTGSGGVRAMLGLEKADGSVSYVSCPYNRESTNGEWQRVSVTANVTSDITWISAIIGMQYASGTAYVDCAQLEYGSSANRYNLVENGSFTQGSYGWLHNMTTGDSFTTTQNSMFDVSSEGRECPEFITHGAVLNGVATSNKLLYQTILINMPANKVALQFSGYACAESVPKKDGRWFAIDLKFNYTDGTYEYVTIDFNYDSTTWQYVSQLALPSKGNLEKTVSSVTTFFLYYKNLNQACFTGMNLNIDKTGAIYSYDENGNVVSAKDMADRETVATIDDANRMTGYTDEENAHYTYTYNEDNATLGTTQYQLKKLVHTYYAQRYEFEYDSHGNVIKTLKRNDTTGYDYVSPMQTNSTYSTNGDRLLSTTDTLRNTTTYGYSTTNSNDLRVHSVTQNNKTVNYEYVDNTGLVERVWSQFQNINGTTQTAENTYVYENDRLKGIGHNGFYYSFDYDDFGNRTSTGIKLSLESDTPTRVLMTNEYAANNGLLLKSTYGNGDTVENIYDNLNRVIGVKYDGTEKFSYVYNSEGLISRHIDKINNKTYNYVYDMIGRVQRVEISDGNSISYKYNNVNQTTGISYKFNGVTKNSTYDYFLGGVPYNTTYPNNATKTRSLNGQAQVRPVTLTTATGKQWSTNCIYYGVQEGGTSYTTNLVGSFIFENLDRTIQYTYDASGNIATRTDRTNSVSTTTEYFYDELNQLKRENDPVANKTTTYLYDNGGNILEKREYTYVAGNTQLGTLTDTITYGYDSEWKDLLKEYNGCEIKYDNIGNPTILDGATLTWERGRKLSSYTKADGTAITYKYDANGIRTQKTVAGVTTDYFLQGSTIVAQKTGNNVIWYYFDGDGTRDAIEYNGNVYYYMYNPQGDVIGLFDDDLNVVVEYAYDSWGNLVSMTGSLASTLGQDNPFRYRGYYYDSETGMYYLNSRYYHPQIGRFINADGYVQTGQGLLDKNMFAYCGNNPVNYVDPDGDFPWAIVAFIVAAVCTIGAGHYIASNYPDGYVAKPLLDEQVGDFNIEADLGSIEGTTPNIDINGATIGSTDGALLTGSLSTSNNCSSVQIDILSIETVGEVDYSFLFDVEAEFVASLASIHFEDAIVMDGCTQTFSFDIHIGAVSGGIAWDIDEGDFSVTTPSVGWVSVGGGVDYDYN